MKLLKSMLTITALSVCSHAAMAQRGASGQVNVLYWQAPSILNPYLSGGLKDAEAASLALEPLVRFNDKGEMVPWLVESVPTVANGGISKDLKTVTYKLKKNVKWSDGSAFKASDVVFTWEYCVGISGCARVNTFASVEKMVAVDDSTVRISFKQPKPNPYNIFVGFETPILQRAQFANCLGDKAPSCTAQNFGPIGTGPFKVKEFRPNDTVQYVANTHYRDPAKPAFATLNLKGGGDAASAARAVLETGEFDYAWNLLMPPEVLSKMEKSGKGKTIVAFANNVERLEVNLTDPSAKLGDARSTVKHPHPFLSDPNVRKALSLAIDRSQLVEVAFGQSGRPTCNLVPAPAVYASNNTQCLKQDMAAAKALLEQAGWKVGADGVRSKGGVRLELLFQTSTNAVRQSMQSLIKQWWSEVGIKTELRNISASVFFGSDPGSPDTYQKFFADVQMYADNYSGIDPESYLANRACNAIPRQETQWQGENTGRFCNSTYDGLLQQLSAAEGTNKRSVLIKQLNDLLTKDSNGIIPLVDRGRQSAHANTLGGVVLNAWDSELWNAADWHRK